MSRVPHRTEKLLMQMSIRPTAPARSVSRGCRKAGSRGPVLPLARLEKGISVYTSVSGEMAALPPRAVVGPAGCVPCGAGMHSGP